MKIYREINGESVEIELTEKERREAYMEEQSLNDKENIEDYLVMYDLDEDTREEFEDLFGFEYEQVSENEELLIRIGKEMRINLDDRGMDYDRAREKAVETVLNDYKAELTADARESNLAKLPERCFGVLRHTGQLIIIVKGEDGYYDASSFSANDATKNARLADEHNAEMGVSKAQAEAMLAGSMFGWHVPAADPDNYDENGRLNLPKKQDLDEVTYSLVASKSVRDSDGFMTDYSWYKGSDGTHAFVFGDDEIYSPEDGWFDHVCEDEQEAKEWFDSYSGFEDDELDAPSLADIILEAENEKNESLSLDVEMTYAQLHDFFYNVEKCSNVQKHVTGYIVFDQSSFKQEYSEESRTYVISSDNKAFQPGMGGYSIYGSCLDGTDRCVRLEGFIRGFDGKPWDIERCYMKREEYNKGCKVIDEKKNEQIL